MWCACYDRAMVRASEPSTDAVTVLVVFDTTEPGVAGVAQAIAAGLEELGSVRLLPAAVTQIAEAPDLLVAGGPADAGLGPDLGAFLGSVPGGSLKGVPATAFCVYRRGKRLMTRSAASQAAGRLGRAGCQIIMEPACFQIGDAAGSRIRVRTAPKAVPAEFAESWGRHIARRVLRGMDGATMCEFQVGGVPAEVFMDGHWLLRLRVGREVRSLEPLRDRKSWIDPAVLRTWDEEVNGHSIRIERLRTRWLPAIRPTRLTVLVDGEFAAEQEYQLLSLRRR
jgi:hypothetical protein